MTIGWTGVILFLTLSPDDRGERHWIFEIQHIDKVAHFGLFFILSILSLLSFKLQFKKSRDYTRAVIIYGFLFSLITEVGQMYVEGRSSSVFDFLADILGTLIGLYAGMRLFTRNE